MALQFVIGSSGCGKSHLVYESIIKEAVMSPNDRFFVIVPEQFSMQTQKDIIELSPNGAVINIDTISFNRLAYNVFAEIGFDQAPVLDDSGKVLVLQKILSENEKELTIFKKMIGKSGSAATLNSLISEFVQYRVETEKLCELKDDSELSAMLRYKLGDLEIINKAFNEYLNSRYLIAEEVPEILSAVIEKSENLKDSVVVLDGFTGFVPTQLMVIEKLMKICKRVIVVLTGDEKMKTSFSVRMTDLFYMSQQCMSQLFAIADKNNISVDETVYAEANENSRLYANKELSFLENNLFRYKTDVYHGDTQAIYIGEAADYKEEIVFAAETILRLVRERGYMFRDFAFVTGALDEYGTAAERIFSENGINCFLDQKKEILKNCAVEYVRASIALAVGGYSYKSVFRYLKNGFSGFAPEEVDIMENYVLAFGIRSLKGYSSKWEKISATIKEDDLERLNIIREKFLEETSGFIAEFKKRGSSIRSRTVALYKFIRRNKIPEKCEAYSKYFEENNKPSEAREYARSYDVIVDLLDKLVEIMGDEKVSLKMYQQLTDAGFSDLRLGIIPPKMDQVTIGDIERTRLTNVKVLFVAGVNEGTIPKVSDRTSLFSKFERNALNAKNVKLAPDASEEIYRQRLYLYLYLAKPSEKLYITYRRTDASGKPVSKAYMISLLQEMYPKLKVRSLSSRSCYSRLETFNGISEMLAKGVSGELAENEKNCFAEAAAWAKNMADGRKILRALDAGLHAEKPQTDIGKKAAELIYNEIRYSSSRLEKFAACEFAHFLEKGLCLRERDIYDISSADMGKILHLSLKLFGDRIRNREISEMSEEKRDALADEILYEAIKRDGSIELPSADEASEIKGDDIYIAERLKSINRAAFWAVYEQLRRGSFKVYTTEAAYKENSVKGAIDRIDICKKDDVVYFRVIDYKSGATDVSLRDFYYGLQLQLPLYVKAAEKLIKADFKYIEGTEETVMPAGSYYCHLEDPIVKVDSMETEMTDDDILAEMRLKGYSSDDPEVIELIDAGLSPGNTSVIIPVKMKKDGSYDAYSKVMPNSDFKLIGDYTDELINRMRSSIEAGKADINPVYRKNRDSCTYCPYIGICRFDGYVDGYTKRVLPEMKDVEVLEKIYKELMGKES